MKTEATVKLKPCNLCVWFETSEYPTCWKDWINKNASHCLLPKTAARVAKVAEECVSFTPQPFKKCGPCPKINGG